MSVTVAIQLRSGGSRLARKIYRLIDPHEMWERVYLAAESTGLETVLAYPTDDEQLRYIKSRRKGGYIWISGEDEDVLTRFLKVAEKLNLTGKDQIVRLSADCPLLTKEAILSAVYGAQGKEYYYNGVDGLDVEVFTVDALVESSKNTKGKDRQHVTRYLRGKYMPWVMTTPHLLSVDTEEELELIRDIIKKTRKQGWIDDKK